MAVPQAWGQGRDPAADSSLRCRRDGVSWWQKRGQGLTRCQGQEEPKAKWHPLHGIENGPGCNPGYVARCECSGERLFQAIPAPAAAN